MDETYVKLIKSNWWKHLDSSTGLILSDDLDSLLSCMLLQTQFKCYISSFYNFKERYKLIGVKEPDREIGVDVDFCNNQYTFGNHVTKPTEHYNCNKNAINLNNLFNIYGENPEIYHSKFSGSTFITILSLYDFDVDSLTEETKMIILCIDGFYQSYFSPYKRDNISCKKFLTEVLSLSCLYETLERHTKDEFQAIVQKYKLDNEIKINNYKLQIDCNLFELSLFFYNIFDNWIELPKNKLELQKTYKTGYGVANEVRRLLNSDSKLISLAVTSKYYSSFSYC